MSGFDSKSFMTQQFKHREESVDVEELKPFFGGKKPVWVVRGMTGAENARANAATEKNSMMLSVVRALRGGESEDKVDALRDILGVQSADVPGDIVRRKEILISCSVDPVCDESLAVKIADTFPTVFYSLTQKAIELTGLGQDPGKLKPSGKTKA